MERRYLMLSWMVIVFPFCEATNESNNCLSCDEINRLEISDCVANYDECGHCKPGFLPSENKSQNCSKFDILGETKEMLETAIGSSVVMGCTFNAEVVCVWTFEKQTMAMEGNPRFEFAENPDGVRVRRKDCSFRIVRLTQSDTGIWECSNAVTSTNNHVIHKSIRLNTETETENLQRFQNSQKSPLYVSIANSSMDTLLSYLVSIRNLLIILLVVIILVYILFYVLWKRFWKRLSKSQESLV